MRSDRASIAGLPPPGLDFCWQTRCIDPPPVEAPLDVVWIPAGRVILEARLTRPPDAGAIVVLFGRDEARSQSLSRWLADAGFATLLVDLLTPEESADPQSRIRHQYDLRLLARRLAEITHWLSTMGALERLGIGYLAYGPEVAAALATAADLSQRISAIVALSGHPRDCGAALANVTAPTLLLAAHDDGDAVYANQLALVELPAGGLAVLSHARHRFEEPQALAEVAHFAIEWFRAKFADPLRGPETIPTSQ